MCVCVYIICPRESNTSLSSNDEENQNIIVCFFDIRSPRISAFEVHKRFYNIFVLEKTNSHGAVQLDGTRAQVRITFRGSTREEGF